MTEPLPTQYGVVPAVVTSNDDGDRLGRVKVRFPWMDQQQESDWVAVASPFAGKQRGCFFVPEVEDLVLVAFAYGRLDRAYVIGSLWSRADPPPADEWRKRTIKSASGHVITLDDSDDAPAISIVDSSGKNKIVLDAKHNTVTIESDGALTIKAKGTLGLTSEADVSIKGKNVSIEGKNVSIEATGNATVKGSKVALG